MNNENTKNQQGNSGNTGHGGGQEHQIVAIHIAKDTYKSPNPTTGAALYILGQVDTTKFDLFREVHGKGDDELIKNDNTGVSLKDGDHFYTAQKKLNPGA